MASRNQELAVARMLLTPVGLPVLQELVQKHLDAALARQDADAIAEYVSMRKQVAEIIAAQGAAKTDPTSNVASPAASKLPQIPRKGGGVQAPATEAK